MAESKTINEETIPDEEKCFVYPIIEMISFIGRGVFGKDYNCLDPEIRERRKIWDATKEQLKNYSNEEIIENILERMNGLMPLNAALLDELFERLRFKMTSL